MDAHASNAESTRENVRVMGYGRVVSLESLPPISWASPGLRDLAQSRFHQWLALVLGAGVIVFFWLMYFHTGSRGDHRALYYLSVFLPFFAFVAWRADVWRTLTRSFLFLLMLLSWGLALLTAFIGPGGVDLSEIYDVLRYGIVLITFFGVLAYVSVNYPAYLSWLLLALVVGITVAAVYQSTVYFLGQEGFSLSGRLRTGLAHLDNPIRSGQAFAAGAVIASALALKSRSKSLAIGFWLAAAICLVPVVLGQSRGPLVAVVVAILVLLALERHWKKLVIALVGGAVMGAALLGADTGARDLAESRNVDVRLAMYPVSWDAAMERPVFGQGWIRTDQIICPTTDRESNPHNTYMTVLIQAGFVGLFVFLLILVLALRIGWRECARPAPVLAAFGVLVFYAVHGIPTSEFFFANPGRVWTVFVLPVGILMMYEIRQRMAGANPSG